MQLDSLFSPTEEEEGGQNGYDVDNHDEAERSSSDVRLSRHLALKLLRPGPSLLRVQPAKVTVTTNVTVKTTANDTVLTLR